MAPSSKDLDEFKVLMKKDYGVDLDDEEVLKLSLDFMTFFEAVLKSHVDALGKSNVGI